MPVYIAALDQRNLAGIGNVYANELCFLRGVLPTRPVGEVADVPAFVDLAERMLQANKDRWVRSTTGDLRPGNTSAGSTDAADARAAAAAPACSAASSAATMQERTVTWCPSCQR